MLLHKLLLPMYLVTLFHYPLFPFLYLSYKLLLHLLALKIYLSHPPTLFRTQIPQIVSRTQIPPTLFRISAPINTQIPDLLLSILILHWTDLQMWTVCSLVLRLVSLSLESILFFFLVILNQSVPLPKLPSLTLLGSQLYDTNEAISVLCCSAEIPIDLVVVFTRGKCM